MTPLSSHRAAFGCACIEIAWPLSEGNAMKFPRRRYLQLALATAAASVFSYAASALDYPTRPVRLIVPVAPGGGADITARLIGQGLSERLSPQCTVENRPGGGTNIGTE